MRTKNYYDNCRVELSLSDTAMIFPIYLIAFEKMRKKFRFWKKKIQFTFIA